MRRIMLCQRSKRLLPLVLIVTAVFVAAVACQVETPVDETAVDEASGAANDKLEAQMQATLQRIHAREAILGRLVAGELNLFEAAEDYRLLDVMDAYRSWLWQQTPARSE